MGLAPLTPRTRAALVSGIAAGPLLAAWLVLPLGASAAPYAVRGQASGAVKATADNKFDPATVTVAVGGTVTWTNEGGFHTVTGGTGPSAQDPSKMNGTLDAAGKTYAVKFDKAGTFPYFCSPHESLGMKGEVVVVAAGASTAPSASATTQNNTTATPRPASGSPAPAGSSTSEPREGGQGVTDTATAIPGTGSDNQKLEEIHREELAGKDKIGGFNALLGGITAGTVALAGAVFASTRPRRAGR